MKNYILVIAVLALTFSVASVALAADEARVISITGQAQYQKAGQEDWQPLVKDMVLSVGDSVKAGDKSEVLLELSAYSKTAEVTVRKNSLFTIASIRHDDATKTSNTLLDVQLGAVLVKAEKLVGTSTFEVKTPTSIVGIRGTTFEVEVSK